VSDSEDPAAISKAHASIDSGLHGLPIKELVSSHESNRDTTLCQHPGTMAIVIALPFWPSTHCSFVE
jgi:hypothetical protein